MSEARQESQTSGPHTPITWGWKAIVAFVAYGVGLGLLFAYANSRPRHPPVYSVFMFVGGWLGLAAWFVARIAKRNPAPKRPLPFSPRTLLVVATVFPCWLAWGGWTVRSTTWEAERWPFFVVSVWTGSALLTWLVAKLRGGRRDDASSGWPMPRFSLFNLLLSVSCFAIAIAGVVYATTLGNRDGFPDGAFMIAIVPTSGLGIGGGFGALFNRLWRGIFLGLIFQLCQLPFAWWVGFWLFGG